MASCNTTEKHKVTHPSLDQSVTFVHLGVVCHHIKFITVFYTPKKLESENTVFAGWQLNMRTRLHDGRTFYTTRVIPYDLTSALEIAVNDEAMAIQSLISSSIETDIEEIMTKYG